MQKTCTNNTVYLQWNSDVLQMRQTHILIECQSQGKVTET